MKIAQDNRSRVKAIRARCLECSETELDIKHCPFNGIDNKKCPSYPFRFGMTIQAASKKYGKELVMGGDEKPYSVELSGVDKKPSKAVRAKCLECTCGSSSEVRDCDCDGQDVALCPLYVFRLGKPFQGGGCEIGPERLPTPGVEYV